MSVSKKPFNLLVFCLLPVLFSGCFEVVEDVTTHMDGSGKFSLTVNMSQSRTKLNSIMLLDSVNGYKVPGRPEIIAYLSRMEKALVSSKGITAVKVMRDMDNFIFSVKFNFDRTENLNRALETVNRTIAPKNNNPLGSIYLFSGRVFQRTESYFDNAALRNTNRNQLSAFSEATYTGIYRFDRPVKSISNRTATISSSGKAVMIKTFIPALVKRTTSLANIIELK